MLQPAASSPDAPDPGDQHLWNLLGAHDDLLLVTGDMRLHGAAGMASRIVSPRSFIELLEAL